MEQYIIFTLGESNVHEKRFFHKIKVQNQLYLIYLVTILVPVAIIGSYLIYSTRSQLLAHYNELAYADNLRAKSLLLDITSHIYDHSKTLASDETLLNILSTDYQMEPEKLATVKKYTGFQQILSQDISVQQIDIYTYNETIPQSAQIHPATNSIRNRDWFVRASSSVSPFWDETAVWDSFGNETISLCLHTRIYAPGPNSSYTGPLDLGKKMIGCVSPLLASYSRDLFYIASVNNSGYTYIENITRTYLSILLLILLATSIFISLFSHYFSRRVIALREAMHNASLGNYNVADKYPWEDEISDIFADLNIMIQDILHKEASIYEAQIRAQQLENQQQRMEFKMLTSQINPHFLYNTLETIRMRSIRAGCLEVANAVKLLGKSMRYVLQNTATSFTTLEKELDYIRSWTEPMTLSFS